MILAQIDNLSGDMLRRYDAYLLGLKGLLSTQVSRANITSTKSRREFDEGALRLSRGFATDEVDALNRGSRVVAESALSYVRGALGKRSERIGDEQLALFWEMASAGASDVGRKLSSQVRADLDMAKSHLLKMAIRVNMLKARRGWSEEASLIRIRSTTDGPKFSYLDRAGRRWGSERYMRALIRGHYLSTYNDAVAYLLGVCGESVVGIECESVEKQLVCVTPGCERAELTYDEIRTTRLHPGAKCLVTVK